jgi:hypothetical protein
MGETSVFPDGDCCNANLLLAQDATLSQGGTLQSLSFYANAAAGSMRLGVYSAAGQIIVQTAAFAPVAGWNTQPVGHVAIPAGTYWLAYTPSSNGLQFPVERVSGTCRISNRTYQAMPMTYPAFGTDQCHWSFYATLSVP